MTDNDAHVAADWIETSVGVRLRPDLAVIDVGGEDQRTWLNGQISNDVRETQAGDAVYALVLNIRGKILCDLWALDRGDGFSLLVPTHVLDEVRTHLEQYIIMEDVVLTQRAGAVVVSAQGPSSRALLAGTSLTAFACDELGVGGYHVLTTEADASALMAQLGARATELGGGVIGDGAYEVARLRRAVPRFGKDFDIHHYPQEAGLKQRAVSFSKGCYLGQEVVCTLESRGKLSRKLVALRFNGQAPEVGDTIATDAGDASGAITSVGLDRDGGHALGYVRRIHIDPPSPLRTPSSNRLTIDRVVGSD